MNEEQMPRQLRNVVTMGILLVLLALGAGLLRLIALAVLLSFILAPITAAMEKRRTPRVVAVAVTMLLALSSIGIVGYIVAAQVAALAEALPTYEANIVSKLEAIKQFQNSPFSKLNQIAEHIQQRLDPTPATSEVQVVARQGGPFERIQETLDPFARFGETVFICLFLVSLILLERDSLGQRIVKLAGKGQLSITTKTLNQIGTRLSRYLARFSLVNLLTGVSVGLGLWAIGLPFAVLWGVLGGLLRFIPFVGPTIAFLLPVVFSIAHFTNWVQPALVVGYYLLIELVTTVLEPYYYGKAIGVSAVSLFVCAITWTWLWGPLGLLIATPLTVCLVVLGKSVPAFRILAVLLSDDVELSTSERVYQRMLRRDFDGATALLDETLANESREQLYDTTILPLLGHASADLRRKELDREEWLDLKAELTQWIEDQRLALGDGPAASTRHTTRNAPTIIGVASLGGPDEFALAMLQQLLDEHDITMKVITVEGGPLVASEAIAEASPDLVVVSHFPGGGLTWLRYLTRRLRARVENVPVLVGLWNEVAEAPKANTDLGLGGSGRLAATLAQARDFIVAYANREELQSQNDRVSVPLPA